VGDTSVEAMDAAIPAKRNTFADFWRALWGLSLGDKLNVVMFILAVVSIYIAIQAYRDAHESGVQQAQLLSGARDALRSEVLLSKEYARRRIVHS
jgi:hypothetical protein